ncbi:DUF4391 domain-containing protein [Myroides odoratimimus]|uniref:DUF4391 domain-containing protein n=1 Tax=Myroides odoratimimus TaxID=76832 RepID=UPI002096E1E9|nr:DUF4391 domain-containing protein [Myroides odoratimimus]MCO7722407.1 DUF4391 domain-containing protein [Myroides odoratimimus]
MNNLLSLFKFPHQLQLDIPIKKISLKENDNCTASERKLIEGSEIQSIRIKALLKKETANITSFQSAEESFVEVYVIEVIIKSEVYTKTHKAISRLLHKLIPHHCIIITTTEEKEQSNVSLATKNISKNSSALRVIQHEYHSPVLDFTNDSFIEALAYTKANKQDLRAFYLYYLQVFQNYNLMDITKGFTLRSYEITKQMLQVQEEIQAIEYEIKSAVKTLSTTTQMNDKVQLNMTIHSLKKTIEELKNKLN